MPTTTYSNSVSYLQHQHILDARKLGWIDTVFYGADLMSILPVVPTTHFMREEYFERGQNATKLTQKRKLNEEPSATSQAPFRKKTELTNIYWRRTDQEIRLAEEDPSAYDTMLMADAKDMVMDINYDIINGVPDADGYGLQGLASRVAYNDSNHAVNAGAALNINSSATNFKKFIRLFRAAVDLVKPAPGAQIVAFANQGIIQGVSSGRDELGANVVGVGVENIMNQRVTSIDGVPLFKLRTDSIGTEILPFTETDSSSSIWIASIGGGVSEGSMEKPHGLTVLSGDEVIRQRTNTTLTQVQTGQEMDIGLRVPKYSVARLSWLTRNA